jgi:hypothetical protein
MLPQLPAAVRVFLCSRPTDMRKSFDGLFGMVREFLGQDPLSGHLFLFLNRRRDRVKSKRSVEPYPARGIMTGSTSPDSVAPDRRGINAGDPTATFSRGWGSVIPRQALCFVRRPDPDDHRPLMTGGAFVAS